ncbi:hypothetical protein [uncultured Rikenella sp.]|uniref:hypothetical protein n=1 Tax=uncultured Rikenella sp. TaxID=368003 RepID=UPI00262E5FDA|nr:hypothetical protein [uncultured Rikenella sp.]
MKTNPTLTPVGVRRLLTFIPAKATVTFSGSGLLPATTLKVDYFYLSGLLERVYLLHQARCFRRERISVTLHDGRQFEWDAQLALQCFNRRRPDFGKLMTMIPELY